MRGPRGHIRRQAGRQGITPAYAGTTIRYLIKCEPMTDHPRLCGDHYKYITDNNPGLGSPPLMRGPPVLVIVGIMGYGITPAYAGTTSNTQTLFE